MIKRCKVCKEEGGSLAYRTFLMIYLCDNCYISERKKRLEASKKSKSISVKKEDNRKSMYRKRPKYFSDYQNVCKEIIKTREYECRGCGATNVPLDFSHTVARSQYPQLITEPDNIELMCRNCHYVWENGNIEEKAQLRNFRDMAKYMRFNAYNLYVKLMLNLGLNIKDIPNDPNEV